MSVIEIEHLTKQYRVINRRPGLRGAVRDLFSAEYRVNKAVDDISLRIESGEMVGYIGPNGAGKSTTIKMMCGILKPSAGKIHVDGSPPYANRQRNAQNIGVVFGQRSQLWWNLPVIESFKLLREIYRVDKRVYEQQMGIFNDLLNLQSFHSTPARELSLGQRMLCDVAAAFLHTPKVVFLDEPTIGLDVSVKSKIRTLIQNLNTAHKTTIILTTHDLGDVEALCRRIVILDEGKVIFDGPTEKVNRLFGAYRTLKVQLAHGHDDGAEMIKPVKASLQQHSEWGDGLSIASTEAGWVDITLNQDQVPLLGVLSSLMAEFPIGDARIVELSLANVIQRLYEGSPQ